MTTTMDKPVEPDPTRARQPWLDDLARSKSRYEDDIRQNRPNLYRSFLHTRLLVGACGVLLPVVLLVADGLVYQRRVRGSLSAYYYDETWLHVWFVGSLWAIGVGLMVYMGTRKSSFASRVSSAAGVFALVVALFPTDEGAANSWVGILHFIAAGIVIGSMSVICVGFGWFDKHRSDQSVWRKWRWVHYAAAGVIVVGIVLAVLAAMEILWPAHGILLGEAIAIFAFGASWFLKGAELWTSPEMKNKALR